MSQNELANKRVEAFVGLLDIPETHYQLATERYHSLSDWLHRPASRIAQYRPAIYPQGSFRYGTVIRPLLKDEEYDLDLVAECEALGKTSLSQKQLKHLLGEEIKAYAEAKGFEQPPEERNRCWTLHYKDQGSVRFHMDALPAVPEDAVIKNALCNLGVAPQLATTAIAITDKRHPQYTLINGNWPYSNPKGFAKWFEDKIRIQAEPRLRALLEQQLYASVDDIPAWEWKTPLQRSIQLLKRHRDVMFKDHPDFAPISMIITTLAAHAYQGEVDLYSALSNIVAAMPGYIRAAQPRIPNPTNPGEDFADRWQIDPRYEKSFWQWHAQVEADIARLRGSLDRHKIVEYADNSLRLNLNPELTSSLATTTAAAMTMPYVITSPNKPWAALD